MVSIEIHKCESFKCNADTFLHENSEDNFVALHLNGEGINMTLFFKTIDDLQKFADKIIEACDHVETYK